MALVQAEIDLCNMSLGRIGAKQIEIGVQGSVEGIQCNLHFAHTRNSLLRSFNWNFASKRIELVGTWVTATIYTVGQYVWTNSLLYKCSIAHTAGTFATDLTAGDWTLVTKRPYDYDYDYEYDFPSDYLRLVDADVDDYAIDGVALLSDEQEIGIEYIYKVTDTTIWDALFIEVFILKLALNMLHPLAGTDTASVKQLLELDLREAISKARNVCEQEQNVTGYSDWNNARVS